MESMKGFVTFEDKKYPFSFSGERLAHSLYRNFLLLLNVEIRLKTSN